MNRMWRMLQNPWTQRGMLALALMLFVPAFAHAAGGLSQIKSNMQTLASAIFVLVVGIGVARNVSKENTIGTILMVAVGGLGLWLINDPEGIVDIVKKIWGWLTT